MEIETTHPDSPLKISLTIFLNGRRQKMQITPPGSVNKRSLDPSYTYSEIPCSCSVLSLPQHFSLPIPWSWLLRLYTTKTTNNKATNKKKSEGHFLRSIPLRQVCILCYGAEKAFVLSLRFRMNSLNGQYQICCNL